LVLGFEALDDLTDFFLVFVAVFLTSGITEGSPLLKRIDFSLLKNLVIIYSKI